MCLELTKPKLLSLNSEHNTMDITSQHAKTCATITQDTSTVKSYFYINAGVIKTKQNKQ